MKYIQLTQGKRTMVDDDDFVWLNQWKWYAAETHPGFFIVLGWVEGKHAKMSRMIMDAKPGKLVDHKNGNTLDNRGSNLRICTNAQNVCNSKKARSHEGRKCTSQYKGVSKIKNTGRWETNIRINGIKIRLGIFKNEIEAALIYNEAAKKYFGEFARLNIIK